MGNFTCTYIAVKMFDVFRCGVAFKRNSSVSNTIFQWALRSNG